MQPLRTLLLPVPSLLAPVTLVWCKLRLLKSSLRFLRLIILHGSFSMRLHLSMGICIERSAFRLVLRLVILTWKASLLWLLTMVYIVNKTTILSLQPLFLLDRHGNQLMHIPFIWYGVVVDLKSRKLRRQGLKIK
jgi:hypothetical protein